MTISLSTPLSFFRTIFTNLWLSVSSVEFYVRVFKDYKGYGVKYIFTLSLISAFICTTIFLNYAHKIEIYLTKDVVSNSYLENIDHVVQQFPEIEYDGSKISVQEETPLYLYSIDNNKVLVLDPDNKLKPSDKVELPVIFTTETIIVNLIDEESKAYYTLPLEYTKIFGDHPQLLTQEVLKSSLASIFSKTSWVFIYLLFPVLTLMIFVNVLLEKLFIIFVIYLMIRFSGQGTSLKTSIRMVFFASGVFVLLQFVIILAVPFLKTVLWMIQIWANFLMIIAILRVSGR
jgi:hypothetical protein